MEVGSLHGKAALEQQKEAIIQQLRTYMVMMGREGAWWEKLVIGVTLLGTEVAFSQYFTLPPLSSDLSPIRHSNCSGCGPSCPSNVLTVLPNSAV
jgi:hypothetical protein